MAVGAAIRDTDQRLLIVKPTYRDTWLVPGGAVEHDESPRIACMRELEEELGLQIMIGRLLCVDYRPSEPQKSESVHFIFDGGMLDGTHLNQIELPPDELERCQFLPPNDALPMLDIHLHRRMEYALVALEQGRTYYLEDGRIPV